MFFSGDDTPPIGEGLEWDESNPEEDDANVELPVVHAPLQIYPELDVDADEGNYAAAAADEDPEAFNHHEKSRHVPLE